MPVMNLIQDSMSLPTTNSSFWPRYRFETGHTETGHTETERSFASTGETIGRGVTSVYAAAAAAAAPSARRGIW